MVAAKQNQNFLSFLSSPHPHEENKKGGKIFGLLHDRRKRTGRLGVLTNFAKIGSSKVN